MSKNLFNKTQNKRNYQHKYIHIKKKIIISYSGVIQIAFNDNMF